MRVRDDDALARSKTLNSSNDSVKTTTASYLTNSIIQIYACQKLDQTPKNAGPHSRLCTMV